MLSPGFTEPPGFARFPRPRPALPLERHLVPDRTVARLARLPAQRPEHPAHVLLYGAPGTGKTSFARALARHLRVPAYAVTANAANNSAKRRAAIQACLNLTSQGEGSLVVRDRFALRPRADVTPGALVAALAAETRLKPGQEARRIGF